MSTFIELFNQALSYMTESDYNSALSTLNEAEMHFNSSDSTNSITKADISILKASIYFEAKDINAAVSNFRKVLVENPSSSEAYLGLGKCFYLMGDLNSAKAMIGNSLEINPGYNDAVNALNEINELIAPNESEADKMPQFLEEAFKFFENKKYADAVELLETNSARLTGYLESGTSDEEAASIYNLMGFLYLAVKDNGTARENFEHAIQHNPSSSQACAGLGEVFYLEANDNDAKVMFEWAVKNNPDNKFAVAGLNKVNANLGNTPDHNTLDKREENIQPELSDILSEIYELFSNNYNDEAMGSLNSTEQLFYSQIDEPNGVELLADFENLKGAVLLSLNKINEAREAFERALNFLPDSSEACAGLGEIFYLEENFDNAKVMFEFAIKNNSENKFADDRLEAMKMSSYSKTESNNRSTETGIIQNKLTEIIELVEELKSFQRFNEALEILRPLEQLFYSQIGEPDGRKIAAQYENITGEIYLASNKYKESRVSFEKALQLNPSSKSYAGLGDVFFMDGKMGNAKVMYEWALKYDAANSYAVKRLEEISSSTDNKRDSNTPADNYSEQTPENVMSNVYELFRRKKFDHALKLLNNYADHKNFESEREVGSSVNNLKGFNYLGLNRVDDARKCFETALNLNPNSSQACAGLGEVLFITGKDSESKIMFEQAVNLDENNVFASEGLKKINRILSLAEYHNARVANYNC